MVSIIEAIIILLLIVIVVKSWVFIVFSKNNPPISIQICIKVVHVLLERVCVLLYMYVIILSVLIILIIFIIFHCDWVNRLISISSSNISVQLI